MNSYLVLVFAGLTCLFFSQCNAGKFYDFVDNHICSAETEKSKEDAVECLEGEIPEKFKDHLNHEYEGKCEFEEGKLYEGAECACEHKDIIEQICKQLEDEDNRKEWDITGEEFDNAKDCMEKKKDE